MSDFHFWAMMNNATMNVSCTSFCGDACFCFPRSGIAVSRGYSMSNLFEELINSFPNGSIILQSQQQCVRVLGSPHLYQYLLLSVFCITVILVDVKWYLTVVLICFSQTKDVEHLFTHLLAICISPLETCLLKTLAHF